MTVWNGLRTPFQPICERSCLRACSSPSEALARSRGGLLLHRVVGDAVDAWRELDPRVPDERELSSACWLARVPRFHPRRRRTMTDGSAHPALRRTSWNSSDITRSRKRASVSTHTIATVPWCAMLTRASAWFKSSSRRLRSVGGSLSSRVCRAAKDRGCAGKDGVLAPRPSLPNLPTHKEKQTPGLAPRGGALLQWRHPAGRDEQRDGAQSP